MSEHRTIAKAILEVTIGDEQVAQILRDELISYFGLGGNVFIRDGYLWSKDYLSETESNIRKVSEEEIELYKAFKKVESHFERNGKK